MASETSEDRVCGNCGAPMAEATVEQREKLLAHLRARLKDDTAFSGSSEPYRVQVCANCGTALTTLRTTFHVS